MEGGDHAIGDRVVGVGVAECSSGVTSSCVCNSEINSMGML